MSHAQLLKRLVFGLCFSCVSAIGSANDGRAPQASAEQIASLTAACQQIAQEEEVEDSEMSRFVFDCLNDQLTEMGYQRVMGADR